MDPATLALGSYTAINLVHGFLEIGRLTSPTIERFSSHELVDIIIQLSKGIFIALACVFTPLFYLLTEDSSEFFNVSSLFGLSALTGVLFFISAKIAAKVSEYFQPAPLDDTNLKWADSTPKRRSATISFVQTLSNIGMAIFFGSPLLAINALITAVNFYHTNKQRDLKIRFVGVPLNYEADAFVTIENCVTECYLKCIAPKNLEPDATCCICLGDNSSKLLDVEFCANEHPVHSN